MKKQKQIAALLFAFKGSFVNTISLRSYQSYKFIKTKKSIFWFSLL